MWVSRRLRRLLGRLCCLGGFLLVLFILMNVAFYQYGKCSDQESREFLTELCNLYDQRQLEGNLCNDLCVKKVITYVGCTNYREGKKIILAKWHQYRIILKSKKGHFFDYSPVGFSSHLHEEYIPSEEEFRMIIADSLKFNLNIPVIPDHKLLSKMWSMDIHQFLTDHQWKKAAMQSLWNLMQQDEYVIMRALGKNRFMPVIFGSCGHFYAMEYLPPGGLLAGCLLPFLQFQSDAAWEDHVRVAVSMLELLKSFEEDFHEVLHICDVKGENFGLNQEGSVKMIDVDMAVFDSKLIPLLSQSEEACHRDEDCHFFDCHSSCSRNTGRCLAQRTNNNLQVVCQYVFLGNLRNAFHGLLHSPPEYMRQELDEILSECAKPSDISQSNRMHWKTYWQLHQLLTHHLYPEGSLTTATTM